jgi:hypothetical protein
MASSRQDTPQYQPEPSDAQALWVPLPLCTPLGYQYGRQTQGGLTTGRQYFDNDEDTRYLYQDFAAL